MTDKTNWKRIFFTANLFEAELARTKLIDNGIECKILNKQDSAYLFGEIELYVLAQHVVKAKHIISNIKDNE